MLVKRADDMQAMKYVLHNVARNNGKTVTIMLKPLVGDNGTGTHVHQCLSKQSENLLTAISTLGFRNSVIAISAASSNMSGR
jgi:glutamine synthetase